MRFTLNDLTAEAAAADQERVEDALKYGPESEIRRWAPYLPVRLPKKTSQSTSKHIDLNTLSAISTLKNNRTQQEDRANVIVCDSNFSNMFLSFSTEKKAEFFAAAILKLSHALEDYLKQIHSNSGSTLVASFSWTSRDPETQAISHHALVLNIGDSRATMITKDPKSGKRKATRLSCHHTPLREHERKNLEKKGFKIVNQHNAFIIRSQTDDFLAAVTKEDGYISPPFDNKSLQCLRSLGDLYFHHASPVFIDEPSLSYHVSTQEEAAYLSLCSDGISDLVSDENQAEILQSLGGDFPASEMVKSVTELALDRKTQDNSSITVMPIFQIPEAEVVFQFVADGHGGTIAAEFIHSFIMQYLNEAFFLDKERLLTLIRVQNPTINIFLQSLALDAISVETATQAIEKEMRKIKTKLTANLPRDSFFQNNKTSQRCIDQLACGEINFAYAYRRLFELHESHFKTLEAFGNYCSLEDSEITSKNP